MKTRQHALMVILILIALLILLFLGSFLIGRYQVSFKEVLEVLFSALLQRESVSPEMAQSAVLKVRLPRICAAVLVGGALSVSGAVYQGLFRNPMVSPDILGASSGAGFGAALAILLSFSFSGVQFMAFAFGILAVMAAYGISSLVSHGNKDVLLILVLSGMVISTLFSSFIALAKYVADPYSKLPEITYWLLGTLSGMRMTEVKMLLVPLLIGLVPLFLLRWRLNAMAFGEEEAQTMGLNTALLRGIFIFGATLLAASCVAVSGMIGWVGLIIPHLSRMIVGPNYKNLMPATFLIGSIFLLGVDDIARAAFTMELPLGILTSIIGAPFFVLLLFKRKKGWK